MNSKFKIFIILIISFLSVGIGEANELNDVPNDFNYSAAEDGKKIYYQSFIPNNKIDGILIIFQGLGGGGKNDFQYFSKQLSSENFMVNIVHQRGTGYSEGKRGDIEDFDIIINDSKSLIREIKNKYPDKPIFVLGHSLGGPISIRLASDLNSELSGAILLNPMCKLEDGSISIWTRLKYIFNYIFTPSKLTVKSGTSDDIKHPLDKKEVEKAKDDPLVVQKHSMRYMYEAKKIIDASVENAKHAKIPLFLIYGEKDEFVNHSGTEEVYLNWSNADKIKFIIEDGGHGAHTSELIWKKVLNWLKNKV